MGSCIHNNSHTARKNSLSSFTKLQYVITPWTKRDNALKKILKICKAEEKHWIDILNNFNQYDKETKQCIYIISYWLRNIFKSISSTQSSMNLMVLYCKQIKQNEIENVTKPLLSFYGSKKGLFGHSAMAQLSAKKLWAIKRLEFIENRIKKVENIKSELSEYENDWEINENKKRHWRCQICKNYNINTLFFEHEPDNFHAYNYKKEVSKYDGSNAYNIILRCETKEKHHSVYVDHNLRKFEVIERFVMHRCRVCNHNHTYLDNNNNKQRQCVACNHAFKKHDQIWCKHADEFDGSEVIKTRRFKDINGNW